MERLSCVKDWGVAGMTAHERKDVIGWTQGGRTGLRERWASSIEGLAVQTEEFELRKLWRQT